MPQAGYGAPPVQVHLITPAAPGRGLAAAGVVLAGLDLLVALLALAVFVLGPTVAIIDTMTTTLGNYLSEFVRMSLRTTPFRDSTWVGGWTIFYWAWWVSWSPFGVTRTPMSPEFWMRESSSSST